MLGRGPGAAAAAFVLLAAAAGAGVVATGLADGSLGVRRAHDFHEFFRGFAGVHQLGERFEVGLEARHTGS